MPEAVTWPPGWFQDPTGRHDHRWWDGAAWTGHVADAGVASTDDLPAADGATDVRRPAPPQRGARSTSNDPVAVWSLVVGIIAIPVAVVPALGLILPLVAIVLALSGRRRIRTSGRDGEGIAIGGLAAGIAGLALALIVSVGAFVLLAESGDELMEAFRAYRVCLEERSPAECRASLEESLARITR